MKVIIFLSYSQNDSERFKVQEFAKKLKGYDEIDEVLFFEEGYDDFITFMENGIGKCHIFLLFCSENSLNSEFVGIEWRSALSLGKILIPIFTDKKYIPNLLSSLVGVKFNEMDMDVTIRETYQIILKKIKFYIKQESLNKEVDQIEGKVPINLEDKEQINKTEFKEIEKKDNIIEIINFKGTHIYFFEAEVIKEFENLTGKNIILIEKITNNINLGFTVKNNYIDRLIVRNCNLTNIPNSISKLKNLEELYLENNKLINLPENIGNLISLKIINLTNNSLESIPESFGNLKELQKLYLENNYITILPDSLENIVTLQIFTFGNKKSDSIKESPKIRKILKRLQNNGVKVLKKL